MGEGLRMIAKCVSATKVKRLTIDAIDVGLKISYLSLKPPELLLPQRQVMAERSRSRPAAWSATVGTGGQFDRNTLQGVRAVLAVFKFGCSPIHF